MTDTNDVIARTDAYRAAQQRASAALIARDAAIRAALAAGTGATALARAAGINRVHVYRVRDTGPELNEAPRYQTRAEAIDHEIIEAILTHETAQAVKAAYDLEGIAETILGDHDLGYARLVTVEELRTLAEDYRR